MLKLFKYVTGSVGILCLLSSYLTGVKYTPVLRNGIYIDIGYCESFVFLIIAGIVLIVSMIVALQIDDRYITKQMKIGYAISIIGILVLAISVIYCDIYAFSRDLVWNECSFVWFVSSIPASILFILGAWIALYHWYKKRRVNRLSLRE